MTTQIHFEGWREPAQRRDAGARDDECRLGEVVLGRDGEQRLVGRPVVEPDDSCRIPAEEARRERVDLIERVLHGRCSFTAMD